ncbi:MAG: type II toxin-antitoxin system HicA family toxin [Nitrospinae bacterium]|nr:type II toxin-antitoxin system HicA family toxin [Nitrospinota bacterium]
MKYKDLSRRLAKGGWWLKRAGRHETWTNGVSVVYVPRHKEINENTARGILRDAGLDRK